MRIGAIRNYVGAACQCVDGFEAVDSEKHHDMLRDNMFSRNKKTALVTGASSGMGKAIAKRLVEDGYQVYAAARHVEHVGRRVTGLRVPITKRKGEPTCPPPSAAR